MSSKSDGGVGAATAPMTSQPEGVSLRSCFVPATKPASTRRAMARLAVRGGRPEPDTTVEGAASPLSSERTRSTARSASERDSKPGRFTSDTWPIPSKAWPIGPQRWPILPPRADLEQPRICADLRLRESATRSLGRFSVRAESEGGYAPQKALFGEMRRRAEPGHLPAEGRESSCGDAPVRGETLGCDRHSAWVDVGSEEAPTLHETRQAHGPRSDEGIDDELAGTGDLADPVPGWLQSLLPRVKGTLSSATASLGPSGVVNPSAGSEGPLGVEEHRAMPAIDHSRADLGVLTREQVHAVPHVGKPALREERHLLLEAEVPRVDDSEAPGSEHPSGKGSESSVERKALVHIRRVRDDGVDGALLEIREGLCEVSESDLPGVPRADLGNG